MAPPEYSIPQELHPTMLRRIGGFLGVAFPCIDPPRWVLISTTAPRYRILGVYAKKRKAIRAHEAGKPDDWDDRDWSGLVLVGPLPIPRGSDELREFWDPCVHEWTTEWDCPWFNPFKRKDVTRIQLCVTYEGGGAVRRTCRDISLTADAVFFDENAWHTFGNPHYRKVHAPDFDKVLRKDRENRCGGKVMEDDGEKVEEAR